jgi:predicted transcriptional regulator
MTTITVTLSEERLAKLKELAAESGVTPENLLQASVDEWLARQRADFVEAAGYVLQKHAELYRRLA